MSSARRRKRHNSRKVAKGGVTRKMFRDFSWAGPHVDGREICRVGRAVEEVIDGVGEKPAFRASVAVGSAEAVLEVP